MGTRFCTVRRNRIPNKEKNVYRCNVSGRRWPEDNQSHKRVEITLSESLRSADLCPMFQKFSTNSHAGLHD